MNSILKTNSYFIYRDHDSHVSFKQSDNFRTRIVIRKSKLTILNLSNKRKKDWKEKFYLKINIITIIPIKKNKNVYLDGLFCLSSSDLYNIQFCIYIIYFIL